jgi:hypothetical protein
MEVNPDPPIIASSALIGFAFFLLIENASNK